MPILKEEFVRLAVLAYLNKPEYYYDNLTEMPSVHPSRDDSVQE